jgi:primosomal protein N' (replication factor Y)
MACVLPQAVRSGDVAAKLVRHVRLVREFSKDELENLSRRAPRQAEALQALTLNHQPLAALTKKLGATDASLRPLVRNGWIEIENLPVGRDPYGSESFLPTEDIPLNESQQAALQAVVEAMENPAEARPILIHGVTGSGKTEV